MTHAKLINSSVTTSGATMVCLVAQVVHPDEVALCKNDGGPSMLEYASMWQKLPEDVVQRILLFLPAFSQARLRCVCKKWSRLVISSAFREKCNLIAFRRGHRNFLYCKLGFAGIDTRRGKIRLVYRAGLVGLAQMSNDSRSLSCWLLNMANNTGRQLPPLALNTGHFPGPRWACRWEFWLEPVAVPAVESSSAGSGCQVVLMATVVHSSWTDDVSSARLYSYSIGSTTASTGWRTVHHRCHRWWMSCAAVKGGYVGWISEPGDGGYYGFRLARMSWDSGRITQLPDPPPPIHRADHFYGITDPSIDDVFVYRVGRYPPLLTLYKLDESSGRLGWTVLFSGLPPQVVHPWRIVVRAWRVLEHMLILVVRTWRRQRHNASSSGHHVQGLAYHMQDGSCQWFRLPAQAFLFDCTPGHHTKSVFLEPTLVLHLRL